MRITVIIATLNRPKQLRDLTLSSLKKQLFDGFDIVVWDASDNNETREICQADFPNLYYYKAPRKGLTKQRNDAISIARRDFPQNDIVLYLDDDVVLSEDAVLGVKDLFENHPQIYGAGIPIHGNKYKKNIVKELIKLCFLNFRYNKRHMTRYGYEFQVESENNGTNVNWLSGCSMAYRIECFDKALFDERLCLFGGYCLCEDAVFSAKLNNLGYKFKLTEKGYLRHIRDGENRLNYKSMAASYIYNYDILFRELNENTSPFFRVLMRMLFNWNQLYNRVSLYMRAIKNGSGKECIDGFRIGKDAIKYKK